MKDLSRHLLTRALRDLQALSDDGEMSGEHRQIVIDAVMVRLERIRDLERETTITDDATP